MSNHSKVYESLPTNHAGGAFVAHSGRETIGNRKPQPSKIDELPSEPIDAEKETPSVTIDEPEMPTELEEEWEEEEE